MAETISIEVEGIDDAMKKLDNLEKGIMRQVMVGLERAMINTAEDIKVTYKGGRTAPGFKDRSGALRASIRGGVVDSIEDGDEVGFVGAGDESMGSDGKRTKDYVEYIEFGEFSRAGRTSFLRSGVQKNIGQIKRIIADEIDLEKILGK